MQYIPTASLLDFESIVENGSLRFELGRVDGALSSRNRTGGIEFWTEGTPGDDMGDFTGEKLGLTLAKN